MMPTILFTACSTAIVRPITTAQHDREQSERLTWKTRNQMKCSDLTGRVLDRQREQRFGHVARDAIERGIEPRIRVLQSTHTNRSGQSPWAKLHGEQIWL